MKLPESSFAIALFVFQILLLGLYAGYVDYKSGVSISDTQAFYPQFQDVHVMIFIGFGFLMTFLKKYGFGAISYNLLLSAVTIQWATLLNAWVSQRIQYEEGHNPAHVGVIKLDIVSLLKGDFTAAAVLITFGAVLGKVCRLQLFVIAVIECIFFAINEALINEFLHISDAGGSIVVHLFGAYFGLAIAFVLRNSGDEHENEASNYHSDIFSMIGTLFLWVYWPSFNAGLLGKLPEEQNRAVINTYFALASCVITTFFASTVVNKEYKLNMVHIQNATLAGGVAVGTSVNLMIEPWGAILIGMIAGVLSTLGYAYVTPFLSSKLKIHDTCGVHNLHGMPAVFAAIAASVAAASIDKDSYPVNDFLSIYPKNRSLWKQGGYQFAAACVSFGMAIVGGLITGIIVKSLNKLENDALYCDGEEFEVPGSEKVGIANNGSDLEMKKIDIEA